MFWCFFDFIYKSPECKNTAGYFVKPEMDWLDLFIGSDGTLAIFVKVCLRLIKKPDEFLAFWKNFGPVIKEGLYEFNDFHDQIFDFSIFHCSEKDEMITLDQYINDYANDKKKIYYISGENKENLLNSNDGEYKED